MLFKQAHSQCPQIFDYLGNLSNNPYFINCTGSGTYNMNIISNQNWGAYTINWGDGSADNSAGAYTANSLINHVYNSATPDTFAITISIPSQNCTITAVAVMEKPVNASIQIPIGGVTTACAPKALQFINSSTDVSETTVFTWNFGDGSPPQTFNHTNAGQTISHTYNPGTVNCQTAVTLTADNYCTMIPTIANFNPIQIYDIDDAAITPSAFIKCWPDNSFTFTNTTNRNCVPQGNTFQRQEWWNLGNYWGLGRDSIINWRPWPPTTPITVSYPSIGNYTVQLRDSNLCGVDIVNVTVSIVNPPVAGVLSPTVPLCQGSAVTFTNTSATGYSYRWNFGTGGGFVSRPFGPQTFTYNTPGTYTVSVVALIPGAGNACTDTAKTVVTILPRPTANFSVSPNIGCNQILGATFTDNSIDATAWSWNFGNSNTFSGQNPPAQNYTTTGSFTSVLTVTAANTCVHTFTAPIRVYQKPVASFIPVSACMLSALTFTDNSSFDTNDPIISWAWNFGDASPTSTASIQNPTHTYSLQNTYTVQLIINSANCRDTVETPVTVNIKPIADFTATPQSGCPTLSVSFTNLSSSASDYIWNFNNGITSTSNNSTQVFANTGTTSAVYNVSLTAVTPFFCTDTKTLNITVFPKPVSSFTSNAIAGCSPIATTFTNNSTGANTFIWRFGDGATSTSTASAVTHSYTNSTLLIQTFTAYLVATNSDGCKDSTTNIITVYPRPIFNFTMIPSSGCSPLSVNFPPVLGAVNYQWDFGDGSPLNFSTNPTHVFTNTTSASQTYTVQLIATNAFSCADTTYGYPEVFPIPISNFTFTPTNGCSPLISNFTNTSLGATNYTWTLGDGSPNQFNLNASHTYTNNGLSINTHTVTLLVANTFSCTNSSTGTITISPKPNASIVITPTSGCSPLTPNFNNNTTGATTYTWNYGDGSPLNFSFTPSHTYTNNTLFSQTHTVSLIAQNSFLCSDTANLSINVFPKPSSNFVFSPNSGCSALPVTFTNTSIGATTYTWNYGDGSGLTNFPNPNYTYTNNTLAGLTYSISLTASNSFSCLDVSTRTISILPKPNASFNIAQNVGCSPLNTNISNNSSGATTYTWNYGDGTAINNNFSDPHIFNNNTPANIIYSVQLIAANSFNCSDTAIQFVTVYNKPIPNFTLSPNDGCAPLNVNFVNSSTQAANFLWKFGDGNTSTDANTSHTYTNSSASNVTFSCTLVAITPNNCRDSLIKPITVFNKPIANFSVDTPVCAPKTLNFINTSIGGANYEWDFGTSTSTSINVSQTFENNTGANITRTVQLIASSISNCKDTIIVPIVIHPKPEFNIVANPDSGCTDLRVNFPSITGAVNYQWNFGDGNSSSSSNIDNVFINTTLTNRTYTVQLIGTDIYGCKDTSYKVIKVFPKPTAQFQANPNLVFVPNTAVNCTNQSSGAETYSWNFGDGNTSSQTNPSHFYQTPGEYEIYLVATSANGCKDTFMQPSKIVAQLESGIDVPNAFSPNPNGPNGGVYDPKDNSNDVFRPVIKGVDKYELNIFSRWGELLFVSKDIDIGWDGYYKGVLCTQDVYIYKIIATTLDNKKIEKTGDILLLR